MRLGYFNSVTSVLLIFLCLSLCSAIYLNKPSHEEPVVNNITNGTTAPGCLEPSINDFPPDLFTKYQRQHGAALLHVFFCFYCFMLTAHICNNYLLPSLDCICSDFNISTDVAGATFLATASCFPEFFVNIVGTFITESDLGVGAVVGSAVFNTFVTPAFGALAAREGIKLKWRVLSRGCVIYVIAVSALVLVMWDGRITSFEATILMMLFTSYFTLLLFSKKISQFCMFLQSWFRRKDLGNSKRGLESHKSEPMSSGTYRSYFHGDLVIEIRNSMKKAENLKPAIISESNTAIVKEEDVYVEIENLFALPKERTFCKIFWFFFTWPLKFLLFMTIPDIRHNHRRHWYPLTFIMCVIWIAISSYMVSWMTTVVGDTLGISDSIMGITFMAAGGNMPEMVSIFILSRQGHGDMAMSQTLGSNTLDILLCLGLPWTIKTFMTGKDYQIVSGALVYSIISIIICVIGLYLVTAYYKFYLNFKVGLACLFMYTMFLVAATLMELNIFYDFTPLMCATTE